MNDRGNYKQPENDPVPDNIVGPAQNSNEEDVQELIVIDVVCEHCRNKMKPEADFCPVCGRSARGRVPIVLCAQCRNKMRPGINFCTRCGHPAGQPRKEPPAPFYTTPQFINRINRDISVLKNIILMFVILIAVNIIGFLTIKETDMSFFAFFGFEIFDSALVIAWLLIFHKNILDIYYNLDCGIRKYAVVLIAAAPVYIAVHFAVLLMTSLLKTESLYYTKPYYEAGYGYLTVILSICLQPALIEETAFRGIIHTALTKFMGVKETIIVTSAAFAILHFAPISFLYLFLLGVYLGTLRHWSNSLYPPMLAHFLHNFLCIVQETYGILPE